MSDENTNINIAPDQGQSDSAQQWVERADADTYGDKHYPDTIQVGGFSRRPRPDFIPRRWHLTRCPRELSVRAVLDWIAWAEFMLGGVSGADDVFPELCQADRELLASFEDSSARNIIEDMFVLIRGLSNRGCFLDFEPPANDEKFTDQNALGYLQRVKVAIFRETGISRSAASTDEDAEPPTNTDEANAGADEADVQSNSHNEEPDANAGNLDPLALALEMLKGLIRDKVVIQKQKRLVELLIEYEGRLPLEHFAKDPKVRWSTDKEKRDNAWGTLKTRFEKKLQFPFSVGREDSEIVIKYHGDAVREP